MSLLRNILIFVLLHNLLFAQNNIIINDTLNQRDEKGRKHGYWIYYMSENYEIEKNIKKAKYYGYTKYCHGLNMDAPVKYCWLCSLFRRKNNKNDGLILLDGHIKINNGKYKAERFYKNGILIKDIEIDGELKWVIYFDKKYEGKDCSYMMEIYENDELVIREYVVYYKKRWKTIKIYRKR